MVTKINTPGGHDRTLAVKSKKSTQKSVFIRKKKELPEKNLLFFMPKFWGNFFLHTVVSPKWVKSIRRREKIVITMAKLRMAHSSRQGQCNVMSWVIPILMAMASIPICVIYWNCFNYNYEDQIFNLSWLFAWRSDQKIYHLCNKFDS